MKDGVRYHHLLDPDFGEPARGCRSVTIVTNRAVMADVLSTGVFIMGPESGMALIEQLPDVEGVIVTADNRSAGVERTERARRAVAPADRRTLGEIAMAKRKIIVHIATSADGYIARKDGNIDWLTDRPAPKGFYGMPKFTKTVDAKILGRKTFDLSVTLGARFSAKDPHYVFSRRPLPSAPAGVHFVTQPIREFAKEMRAQREKSLDDGRRRADRRVSR